MVAWISHQLATCLNMKLNSQLWCWIVYLCQLCAYVPVQSFLASAQLWYSVKWCAFTSIKTRACVHVMLSLRHCPDPPCPGGTHRCGTCPLTGTSGSGSIGTCCGSSSGSCSGAHTCHTPASDGWSAEKSPGGMEGKQKRKHVNTAHMQKFNCR